MEKLEKWIEDMQEFKLPRFDEFPGIDLYMDQLITYIEKYVSRIQADEKEKSITPAMINNYVKGGVMPRPENKKYSGEHIALSLRICMLKQVISIARISQMMERIGREDVAGQYDRFCQLQESILAAVSATVRQDVEQSIQKEQNDNKALTSLAMQYALTANAYKMAAERIVSELEPKDKEKKNK